MGAILTLNIHAMRAVVGPALLLLLGSTGGAAIAEMSVQVPGRFLLVDHSIVRAMEKGALGVLEVAGEEQPAVFRVLTPGAGGTGGH